MDTIDPALSGGAIAGVIAFYVIFFGFFIFTYVRIIQKAGYSGWWVLMGLVPIGNFVMLGFFAFQEWPIRKELQYLRGYAAHTGLPGYGAPPSGSLPADPRF